VKNWVSAFLGDGVDILDHRRIPVSAKERSKRLGLVPYYGATGQVGWIDEHIFDEELVLLGEDGAPFFDKTKPIAYMIKGKAWVNNHAHVLKCRPEVFNANFLKYYLDNFQFHGFVEGTTRPKLTKSKLERIPVLLPSPAEQCRIVAEIDRQYTNLEAAVALLQRAKANLKRYRTSATEQAFATCRAAPIRHLGDLGEIVGGLTKGQKRKPGTRMRTVPYLRVANVQRGHLDLDHIKLIEATEDEIRSPRLLPGDVLLNEGGDRDKLGRGWIWEGQIEECIHQNHVFRVRLDPARATPRFVSHYANHFGQRYFSKKAGRPPISPQST
jgi:type I restriction enzyme S subunit